MQTLPVYIVSLKGAAARQARLTAHLHSLGIAHEFVEATRGDALDPQTLEDINPSRNLSPAQIGCYLSHIHLYDRIIQQGTPVALILEDDTVLHHSAAALVRDGCLSLDFDYCFLGCDDSGDSGYVFYDAANLKQLTQQHRAFSLSSGPYCTNAYLITLDGAKKRVACAYPARSPIDHYRYLPYTPNFCATLPALAFVNELSAAQSMSSVNWSGLQKVARKYWWYYPLRDILKLRQLRKFFALRSAPFAATGRWKHFVSAFRVVRNSRLSR